MREAGTTNTGNKVRNVLSEVCPPHGGTHGLTTRALKLLMSIGIPLENTKRPEPRRAPASPSDRSLDEQLPPLQVCVRRVCVELSKGEDRAAIGVGPRQGDLISTP